MARSYWSCPCGQRNERIKQRCQCGRKRPKKRVAAHAKTLRDDSYAVYVQVARDIHGVTDESCCACGKPRSLERRCDRDHEHNRNVPWYGKPRGLLCGGNQGCNVLLLPWITPDVARAIARAKHSADSPDWRQWKALAGYLHRVQVYYESVAVAS